MQSFLLRHRAILMAPEDGGGAFPPRIGLADAPILSIAAASGDEDTLIAVDIDLTEVDTAESLALALSGLPVGTLVFADGGGTIAAGSLSADGRWIIGESDLDRARDGTGRIHLWVKAPA
jgi:hypothetical protein